MLQFLLEICFLGPRHRIRQTGNDGTGRYGLGSYQDHQEQRRNTGNQDSETRRYFEKTPIGHH